MAGAGAKKRLEVNSKRLQIVRLVALSAFASFLLSIIIKVFVLRSSSALASFIWLVVSLSIGLFAYSSIASYAAPSYDANGELIDGGGDLDRKGGMNSHMTDLLYISIFAQFGAVFSLRSFYAYALIPAYGIYLATVNFILPWLRGDRGQPTEREMDPLTRKKMERTEKRQQKRATKWR